MKINLNNIANFITSIEKNAEGQQSKQSLMNRSDFVKTFTHLSQNAESSKFVKMQNISNYQMNLLLRDLMSLPKEWSNLLKLLVANNNTANLPLELLLLKNPNIDIKNIAQLLNQNSAKMLDKLLKLSISNGANQQSLEQFREVISIGNAMFSNVSTAQSEILRNTLPLYLPWLPLNDPNLNHLEELKKEFNKKEASQTETLFFITTTNIGSFKISILPNEKVHEIDISNILIKKNEEQEQQLKQKIKDECSKAAVKINLLYNSKLSENTKEQEKQLYIISTDNSMISLILLQLVSRAIFEADERASLINNRKSKIPIDHTPT